MATIYSFKAIRPNPEFAGKLVTTPKNVESVGASPLPPLKDLLETPARLRPESEQGQRAAYEKINWWLRQLLDNGTLLQDQAPGLYIYETEQNNHRQTGVWALTDLSDYRNGHIKVHEATLAESVRRIANYREHTGIEGSPVLLTYEPNKTVDQIIGSTKARSLPVTIGNEHGVHRIWKIADEAIQNQLIGAFREIQVVYLADGHHRLASATSFHTISSLYLSFDELRIREYHRVVLPAAPLKTNGFIEQLKTHFSLAPAADNEPVAPGPDELGLLIINNWLRLKAKQPGCGPELLQQYILNPLLGITDPQNDPRLKCVHALAELKTLVAENTGAIAFTLAPLTMTEITTAADANRVLPPKSTWIDPKIPYGLILFQHETD